MKRLSIIFCLAGLLLSGCAETELASHFFKKTEGRTPQSQGSFKVGKSYQVDGKWYTPTESYSYDETGIASWYGDQFHGKRTANGEIFNKNDLTAAHPTLQIPSLIRVTNLDNGRSAVLRVNDRGPFSRSRLIDVSHQSAVVLGMIGPGTAKVRVQLLERESRIMADAARKGYAPKTQMAMAFAPPTQEQVGDQIQVASLGDAPLPPVSNDTVAADNLPPPQNVTNGDIEDLNKQLFRKFPVSPTSIYIQVGSFTNSANAMAMRNQLSSLGHAEIYPTTVNGQPFSRVRLGPIQSVPDADAALGKALNAGFSAARIVVD